MRRSNIAATLAVLLAVAAACSGQAYQIYAGRALDANNMVGSDGTNPTRAGGPAYDPNAIVNGQVTGGYSFHGNVGYAAGNQLRLNLPSAPMDNFVRDSSGMPQLRNGSTYGPRMYYSPNNTMTAGNIASGMNLPGTSAPSSSLSSPKAQQLYQQAMQPYASAMPSVDEQMRVGSAGALLTGGAAKDGLKTGAWGRGGEGDVVVASGLFGILRPKDQAELASELDQPAKTATSDAKIDTLLKAKNQSEPKYQPGKDSKDAADAKSAKDAKDVKEASDKAGNPDLAARGGAMAMDKTGSLPKPGQDVFVDMLVKMDALKGGKLTGADKTPAGLSLEPEKETPPSLDRYRPGNDASAAKRTGEATPAPGKDGKDAKDSKDAKPAVETAENQLRLHRLAGMGQDEFNRRMLAAEEALSQGQYYRAAGEYEVATIINHVNPLAHLGQAVALFGAFEPLSSARSLREAMHSFPPLMDTDVDIAGLLGKDVVNVRMKMLGERLTAAEEPDAGVIYLACFIYANNGRPDLALEQAYHLKKLSKDEVHQAYAQALIKRFENNLPQPPKQ